MNGITLQQLLLALQGSRGVAPYGLRQGAVVPKGQGYFGPMMSGDEVATEISIEDESGEFPLLVPTLTKKERELVLSGKQPTDEIYKKARMWADIRRRGDRNPFATPQDLRFPIGLLD